MISINKIRLIKSLEHKKYRKLDQVFLVEGEKMVIELLKSNYQVSDIFALKSFQSILKSNGLNTTTFTEVTNAELDKISNLKTPNQAIAIVKIPEQKNTQPFPQQELMLALDNIQDPGNLGTIIRTANWFGISHIFCSPDTVDVYNPKVIQSTMGAIFNTTICYVDLADWLQKAESSHIPVYGTLLDGDNLYSNDLTSNGIIVMGNESKGISDEIQSYINKKLFIPGYPPDSRNIESLNVSVATAIICAEFRRQQISNKENF